MYTNKFYIFVHYIHVTILNKNILKLIYITKIYKFTVKTIHIIKYLD